MIENLIVDGKIDCQWSKFSEWTDCDKTCGGGFQYRERSIKLLARKGGKPCKGEAREKRKCNNRKCARKLTSKLILQLLNKPFRTEKYHRIYIIF